MSAIKILFSLSTPHKIELSFSTEDADKVRGKFFFCALADLNSDQDDWEPAFILCKNINNPDYFAVSHLDIYSMIKLQSGQFVEWNIFCDKDFLNDLEIGKYNQKLNANLHDSRQPIIWNGKPFNFSYPYQGGIRELRLDAILFNPEKQTIYWKCFCYMRKTVRTFKQDTLGNIFIIDNKEFSLSEFYNVYLGIDYSTGEIIN